MFDAVLVLNAGSSSIKFALYPVARGELGERVLGGQVAGIGQTPQFVVADAQGSHATALEAMPAAPTAAAGILPWLLDWLDAQLRDARLMGIGHRVVHGAARFIAPILVDDAAIAALRALVPIARLHQPYEIDAIVAARTRRPLLPQVACFDTAFHHTLAPAARTFALPRAVIDSGVRRYGFHGLSYAYIAAKLPELLADSSTRADSARVIVAHLGSGSSLCALNAGRSVATTMGFTALDGVMMATRAGSIDPGIVLYLIEERGMTVQEVSDMLYRHCGLLGVSGLSADMSELLASEHAHAREAIDLYVYSVVREAGALIAILGGIDAIVFTAGIGEHAAPIRERVCAALSWLGLEIDNAANARHAARISTAASTVSAWVIPTDEELMIARETLRLTLAPR